MDERGMVWDGGYDVRDLGGLSTRDGRWTGPGALLRSASTRFRGADGWKQARDAGVRTVVDLRRDDEPAQDPTATADAARAAGLVVTEVDLAGPEDDPAWNLLGAQDLGATSLFLQPFLAAVPYRVAAVMTALARAPEGGWCSTAGSDGTAPGWSPWRSSLWPASTTTRSWRTTGAPGPCSRRSSRSSGAPTSSRRSPRCCASTPPPPARC